MTTEMLIAALEALNADALISSDDATLDRLQKAAERLEILISDEQERRSPMLGSDLAVLDGRTLSREPGSRPDGD